ncbi:hypothetical protein HD806DRAFT_524121 [Xylariaceae sp. AK1471]|nr:hypothetical protein HD806DRAFT_524121 [Xylariaceae sp. AK1471]
MTSVRAQDSCYGDKSTAGYCTPLTYTDTTKDYKAPPTTSDCFDTCRGINQDAGDWSVDFNDDADGVHHSMILYHCGFAVSQGEGTPRDASFSLANQDILDLYDESINRFGADHGGQISAEGTMDCGGLNITWYIQDLYASKIGS